MSTMPDGTQPASAPNRPSYVVVAAILVLVVALILGGGLFLSQRAQLQPRAAPVTPPLAASVAAPAAEGPSTSTPPVAVASAAAPTSLAASAVPSASFGLQVASTPLEREVEAAYLHYWDVRSQALWTLDTSHLPEVMAGAELDRDVQQVKDLRDKGQAMKIDVNHKLVFLQVSDAASRLYDEYFNKSYYVDGATKQPIGTPGPGGVAKITYDLQKLDGTWKVVDGARLPS